MSDRREYVYDSVRGLTVLRETLAEREQVIAAVKQGTRGPYEFERAVWKRVDLLGDLNPF